MEILNLSLNELKPYTKNPRKIKKAVPYIRESIKQFGFLVPILIDKNNEIIAGHTRYYASKQLDLKTVPCIRVEDLSEEQIKAFRLIDNKTHEFSDWDDPMLLLELQNIFDINMYDFGFDLSEIDKNITSLSSFDNIKVIEDISTENRQSKLGDIYQLGEHFLMCGNVTQKKHVDALMSHATKKIDLLITDPPYNVDYSGGGIKRQKLENDSMKDNAYEPFLEISFANMKPYLKKGCVGYIFFGISKARENYNALEKNDFRFSDVLIWLKNNFTITWSDYQHKYECMIYGSFGDAKRYFVDDRTQTNVWEYNIIPKAKNHPTMKPIDLILRMIKNSSKIHESVVDLFGGSGTTLIACEKTGRKCFMMEIEPLYVDRIIQRWEEATGQKAKLIEHKEF